jgi:hypothetical protein
LAEFELATLWSQMTVFEQLETQRGRLDGLHNQWDMLLTLLTTLFSIITAFLLVAYIAGRDLTRPQVFIASATYILAVICVIGLLVDVTLGIKETMQISAKFYEFIGDIKEAQKWQANVNFEPGDVIAYFALFLVTIAPLYFMWGVRHPKTE